ncbi:MAG: hypothetical protein GY861_12150 [bacterium]|nr:hypothetical protein [bacterium]
MDQVVDEMVIPEDVSPAVPDSPEVPENPVPETPQGTDDISVYQDIVAKFTEDPSFEMSDEESDIFLSVKEQVNSGAIKEPDVKGKEEVPEVKEEPKAEEPTEEPSEEPVENKEIPLSDSVNDSMIEAMNLVGAKEITSLPEKIELLIKNRDSSGGKLGSENSALKAQVADMQKAADNHISWLNALKAGDQNAIDYLHNSVGYQSNPSVAPKESDTSFEGSDEYLDDKLASEFKGAKSELTATIAKLESKLAALESKDAERADEALTQTATNKWVDDVVNLISDSENQKFFGISTKEARGLAEFYFSKKQENSAINPKFQKMHELIKFGYENQMPSLDSANIVFREKNGYYAKRVIEATKSGQKQFKPSVNTELSENQSRKGNNVPQSGLNDEDVDKMMSGDNFEDIPDEWMDVDGNILKDKIPQRFHKRIFGQG